MFKLNKRYFRRIMSPGVYGIFGKPRAGKTSISAAVCAENAKRKRRCKRLLSSPNAFVRFLGRLLRFFSPYFENIYCTDPTIMNCNIITPKELGQWQLPNYSLLILEEAGLLFDNRRYVNFTDDHKHLFAMVGHNKSSILYSSQTADIDKQIRVRSHSMIMVSRLIFNLSLVRPIKYEFGVDNETGDMKDMYSTPRGIFGLLIAFIRKDAWLFYRKPYYKYFDSYVDDYQYKKDGPTILKSDDVNVLGKLRKKRFDKALGD